MVVSSEAVARILSLKGQKSRSRTAPLCPVRRGTLVGYNLPGLAAFKTPTEPPPADSQAIAIHLDEQAE